MDNSDVTLGKKGTVGRITLNRPTALNALTSDMCAAVLDHLRRWALDPAITAVVIDAVPGRAFCAGGDVRAIYEAGKGADPRVMEFFITEYRMNAAIRSFPKLYVALIDGFAFGGGLGISMHGSHRVVSENAALAMPETVIGLFPDIGATYFLNQCPGEIGMYLALTGLRISAADAVYAGLATHFVTSQEQPHIVPRLMQGETLDAVLGDLSATPSASSDLALHRAAIDRAFAANSVEDILAALNNEGEWGRETASLLMTRSPTSLKVTLRQMREGKALDFHACQRMEFRIMAHMLKGRDFYEGVRAALIDKDQAPRWTPARLDQVSADEVAGYFAPLAEPDFTL